MRKKEKDEEEEEKEEVRSKRWDKFDMKWQAYKNPALPVKCLVHDWRLCQRSRPKNSGQAKESKVIVRFMVMHN